MRLGRVSFMISYVVDLDDDDMVDNAYEAVIEDLENAIKFDEVKNYMSFVDDPSATKDEIPAFILGIEK